MSIINALDLEKLLNYTSSSANPENKRLNACVAFCQSSDISADSSTSSGLLSCQPATSCAKITLCVQSEAVIVSLGLSDVCDPQQAADDPLKVFERTRIHNVMP